jgi:cytochrome b involved in lipid metabolism
MRYIYKILRITAWALVVIMPLSLLSGFFMTKSFLVPWIGFDLSKYLHTDLLVIIILPLTYLHSISGILFSIQRHPKWNKNPIKITVCSLWTILFLLMGYLFFVQPPTKSTTPAINQITTASANTTAQSSTPKVTAPAANAETATPATTTKSTTPSFTAAEIASHNQANDCWLLINDKAYDVTDYIYSHPGGMENITNYCGQESTDLYDSIPHSQRASLLLGNYFVGNLKK